MIISHDDFVFSGSGQIIDVVRRSLSKIDPRLVEHGERVGYIAKMIWREWPERASLDFGKLYVLCILHDIGAYKTNEIDDMFRFESERPLDHTLYGYLFLKNTSHLSEYAEALLYHHTAFSAMPEKNGCAPYAELIHLADRADILLLSRRPELSHLRPLAGTTFHPGMVEALLRAEEKYAFSKALRTGAYQAETAETIASLRVSNRAVIDYLKLLVYAIDFRSPYTVTHTADTTLISLEAGRLLGLSQHELEALYIGAFLHDIGKIAIPQQLLEKPGRLTPEEYAVVQRHIPEGEEILRGVISDEVCDIALRHHEKLDGSGYARGLTGDLLTLPQRILAVADIFSALSQRRSYKEPFPREKVVAILTQMRDAGTLCPRAVSTVCENYDLLLRKTEESHDPVKMMYANLIREYAALSASARRHVAPADNNINTQKKVGIE